MSKKTFALPVLSDDTEFDFTPTVYIPDVWPSYKRPPFGIILVEDDTLPEGTIELRGRYNTARIEGLKVPE